MKLTKCKRKMVYLYIVNGLGNGAKTGNDEKIRRDTYGKLPFWDAFSFGDVTHYPNDIKPPQKPPQAHVWQRAN